MHAERVRPTVVVSSGNSIFRSYIIGLRYIQGIYAMRFSTIYSTISVVQLQNKSCECEENTASFNKIYCAVTMSFLRAAVATEITIIRNIIKAYYHYILYNIEPSCTITAGKRVSKTRNTKHFSASTQNNYRITPTNLF